MQLFSMLYLSCCDLSLLYQYTVTGMEGGTAFLARLLISVLDEPAFTHRYIVMLYAHVGLKQENRLACTKQVQSNTWAEK